MEEKEKGQRSKFADIPIAPKALQKIGDIKFIETHQKHPIFRLQNNSLLESTQKISRTIKGQCNKWRQ